MTYFFNIMFNPFLLYIKYIFSKNHTKQKAPEKKSSYQELFIKKHLNTEGG